MLILSDCEIKTLMIGLWTNIEVRDVYSTFVQADFD